MNAPKNRWLTETPPSGTRPRTAIGPGIYVRPNRHQRQTPWNRKGSCEKLVDGQGKRKTRSGAIILRLNFASVRFHDGSNDGETHPETFFFRREKLVEELPVNLRCNAAAPVAHAKTN